MNRDKGIKMDNQTAVDIKSITEEVLSFYESSIDRVSSMVCNTHKFLDEFSKERTSANKDLEESFARQKSLRKKDFECLMNEALPFYEEKENQIKASLNLFLKEQKDLVFTIRKKMTSDEKVRIDEFRELLSDIQTQRNIRESEVCNMLMDFQQGYKNMSDTLKGMLLEERSVRIRDVRNMMKKFEREGNERKSEVKDRAKEWEKKSKEMSELRKERLLRKK